MIEEYNTVVKNPRKVITRYASCYPNIYRVAMSSLGYHIIYDFLNEREDIYCERVIYPQTKSIETRSPLADFDIIGFTLQFEQDYLNMIDMLKRSGIPLLSKDRKPHHPLVIAGGPCAASNPLPISKFVDFFAVGDGEFGGTRLSAACHHHCRVKGFGRDRHNGGNRLVVHGNRNIGRFTGKGVGCGQVAHFIDTGAKR